MKGMLRMRKLLVCMAMVVAVAMGLGSWMVTPAQADQTLNLKATWNPSTDDSGIMGGYNFWYEGPNGTVIQTWWMGTGWTTNENLALLLPVSPQLLLFNASIPDTPVTGIVKFAIRAVDGNGNKSSLSSPFATYNYNIDVTPPSVPTGLSISKQ